MQPREKCHLRRLSQVFLTVLDQPGCFLDFLGIAVWLFFQNRQMTDRLVKLEIPLGRHCFCPDFAKSL